MSNTVTVNINTEKVVATQPPVSASATPEDIRLEALRRLERDRREEEEKRLEAKRQALKEANDREERVRGERVRLLAEEEQVKLQARRLVIEAEAKAAAQAREDAIKAEMERLKNRTQVEILEDKIAELTGLVTAMKGDQSHRRA